MITYRIILVTIKLFIMRIMSVLLLFVTFSLQAQEKEKPKWRIDKNKILTGSLVFIAGAAKGFNETLHFNYKAFENTFPGANESWFNPQVSWLNKYKDNDPDKGPRFFLSTSVFVMVTDQYHLNNFINRAALMSALVIKLGEGKKPIKHYLFDLLYYTVCHQAGFAVTYYPFIARRFE
jgi:hypothetical protein